MLIAFISLFIWGASALLDTALTLRGTHIDALTIIWKIAGWSCIPLVLLAVLLRMSGSNEPERSDQEDTGSGVSNAEQAPDKSLERTREG
jgi:hypothetical protein